jgi:alpha-L-rhamnosidase
LLVSNNLQSIQQQKGNVWTTGKVVSDKNIQVLFNGILLRPFTRYYWCVKVYNASGEASALSVIKWFETAMFNNNDCQAKWISDGSMQPAREEDFYKDDRMPLFRKIFSTNKTDN